MTTHAPKRRQTDSGILAQIIALLTSARVVVTLVAALGGALFAVRKALSDLEAVKVEQAKLSVHVAKADTAALEQEKKIDEKLDPLGYLVAALARGQCHSNPSRAEDAGIPCASLDLPPPTVR